MKILLLLVLLLWGCVDDPLPFSQSNGFDLMVITPDNSAYEISFPQNKRTGKVGEEIVLAVETNAKNPLKIRWQVFKGSKKIGETALTDVSQTEKGHTFTEEGTYLVKATLMYNEKEVSKEVTAEITVSTDGNDGDNEDTPLQELGKKVVLFYPLKEGDKEVIQDVGGFDALVDGTVTWGYDKDAERDVAIFNGNGFLKMDNFPAMGMSNKFTFSFWARAEALSDKREPLFTLMLPNARGPKGIELSVTEDNYWELTYLSGLQAAKREVVNKLASKNPIKENFWYFFVVEYDGNHIRLVLASNDNHDLEEIGTVTALNLMDNVAPTLSIGGSNLHINGFHGKVKNLSLFYDLLSPDALDEMRWVEEKSTFMFP